jgi:hypothetical protein
VSTRAAPFPLTRAIELGLVAVAIVAGCGRAGLQTGVDDASAEAPARTPYRALAVTTGRGQTCALLDDHRVKCWGFNDSAELGLGDTRRRGASPSDMGDALPAVDLGTGHTAKAISGGRYHTCALLDDDSVKCWGMRGFCGVAGDPSNGYIGDVPGEMGDALPALDLGPGRTAKLLASSYEISCAILDDGTASCWGARSDIHVTTPAPVALASSVPVVALSPGGYGVLALFQDGTIQDLMPIKGAPPIIPSGAVAISIAGSAQGKCAVLSDGTLYCGDGATLTRTFDTLTASGQRLIAAGIGEVEGACGLLADGRVLCTPRIQDCTPAWCDGTPEGWLHVQLEQPAVAITTSSEGTFCALLANGAVRCWGQPYGYPPNPNLGGSFDLTIVDDKVTSFGAFRDVDLGSRGD